MSGAWETAPACAPRSWSHERALVVRSEDGRWVWAFVLEPDGGTTRLLSRNRFVAGAGVLRRLANTYLMEPGSLVMERKMLVGIRDRAERLARQRGEQVGEVPTPPTPAPTEVPTPAVIAVETPVDDRAMVAAPG